MIKTSHYTNSTFNECLPYIEFPFYNESLVGYLLRLDYLNDFRPSTILKECTPIDKRPYLEKFDYETIENLIDSNIVSRLTNLSPITIEKMKIKNIRKSFNGLEIEIPLKVAEIDKELASAYLKLSCNSDTEINLKSALSSYNKALILFTIDKYPVDYSGIQNQIGIIYRELSNIRNKKQYLGESLDAHNEALKIYTVEKYPLEYAQTYNYIAQTYSLNYNIQSSKQTIDSLADSFNRALTIYSYKDFPLENIKTQSVIGVLNKIGCMWPPFLHQYYLTS